MPLLGTLQVPTQLVHGPLSKPAQGTPFEFFFTEAIRERPYQGQNYRLCSVNLKLLYRLVLAAGQFEEGPPTQLDYNLALYRGAETVAIWQLAFQMREVPGSGGLEWVGEDTVFADLTNPIDYSIGQTLTFRVSGIVPGKLA